MKKLIFAVLLAALSFSAFAEELPDASASDVIYRKEADSRIRVSEYRGKVSLVGPWFGLFCPTGLMTVHGAYFPQSGFFIGGAVSSFRYSEKQFTTVSVHPEWYFKKEGKVNWSLSLDAGVGRIYTYGATCPDFETGNIYYRNGFWDSALDITITPAVGLSVNFSEKIALDIAMRLEIHTETRRGLALLTPMVSAGVRF